MDQLVQLALWPITTVFTLALYLAEFLVWLFNVCSQLALVILEHTFSLLLGVTSVTIDVGAVAFPLLFEGLHKGGELVVYILVEVVEFLFLMTVSIVNLSWNALLQVGSILWDISCILGHFLVAVLTSSWHWIFTAVYWVTAVTYSSVEFVVSQPWATVIEGIVSVVLNCATFIWTWIIYTPLYYLVYTIWTLVSLPLKFGYSIMGFENGPNWAFERFSAEVYRLKPVEEEVVFVGLALFVLVLACILCCCIGRNRRLRKRERRRARYQNVPVEIQAVPTPLRPRPNTRNQVHRRTISVRVDGTHAPDMHALLPAPNTRTLPLVVNSDNSASNTGKQSEQELQQRLQALAAELERQREEGECVVCKDARRELLLKPCNHYCVCQACVRLLGGKCPMCRKRIQRVEKIFHA